MNVNYSRLTRNFGDLLFSSNVVVALAFLSDGIDPWASIALATVGVVIRVGANLWESVDA